ncbi:MAG: hypothetical protein JKY99_02270 [Rhizobiales bacterium]|nr:hypothetical protein [Hyphomicrobiales bacterium]
MNEPSKSIRDYFKPTSLAWWGGVFMLVIGSLSAEAVTLPGLAAVTEIAGVLAGDTSPALLIGTGLSFIGVRAKLSRQ